MFYEKFLNQNIRKRDVLQVGRPLPIIPKRGSYPKI